MSQNKSPRLNKTGNPFTLLYRATKTVLGSVKYRVWFVVLAVLFFSSYIFLPIWLTPGNTFAFQLSLLGIWDYVFFAVLAGVTALLLLMQVFVLVRTRKAASRAGAVGSGGVGVFSAIFGGLLATAACSSCVAAILGFLGAGSIFFILEQQPYFVAGALALVVIGLYFGARRVAGYCERCDDLKMAGASAKNNY